MALSQSMSLVTFMKSQRPTTLNQPRVSLHVLQVVKGKKGQINITLSAHLDFSFGLSDCWNCTLSGARISK